MTSSDQPKQPRGRPSKASLAARDKDPSTSPNPVSLLASSAPRRRGYGPSPPSAVGSESASSALTPVDALTDSDSYSTPGTSKVPTPATSDLVASSKPISSIQVVLPSRQSADSKNRERTLRKSIFSLRPAHHTEEIGDSDDENDDFSDASPDAATARRLQTQEYANLDVFPPTRLPSVRRSQRISSFSLNSSPVEPSKSSGKRPRSATNTPLQGHGPAKRTRMIPDSDELAGSDIDVDAEIAVGAAFDSDGCVGELNSHDYDSLAESDFSSNADDESEEAGPSVRKSAPKRNGRRSRTSRSAITSDSEDLPLSSTRRTRKAASKTKSRAERQVSSSTKAESRATGSQPPPSEIEDGLPERSWDEVDVSEPELESSSSALTSVPSRDGEASMRTRRLRSIAAQRRAYRRTSNKSRACKERDRLEAQHPKIKTMWHDLKEMPLLKAGRAVQPRAISRLLKPFQLEGLAWMSAMEGTEWKGGLLGDEMGLGKTIQAVSLIMSDYPAKQPSLVLVPPVALMQWQSEIKDYTDGTLKTFVFHGTNQKAKGITVKELKKYDVIMMSYNSLESMYRKQEKGFKRKDGIYQEKSVIHAIQFHRVILDEAHCIKTRTTMTAKACFALKADFRWCLTGTPLQNRIGEFFSLIRFLNMRPFAEYLCKYCPCAALERAMNDDSRCTFCNHAGIQHVSVFNQELLNPIQQYGNTGPGKEAFRKLRLMTDRIMLRRLKRDHTNSMELPVKEIYVDRQFFGEEENDFANSIMTSGQRKFDTYVSQGVLLNNYANIFGLIMQMRQVADHPDLILKKNAEGGQNIMVCSICDEPAEDTIRSRCKHDFCRACVSSYVMSTDEPDCPRCHIPLSIDLEQPEIEQDENVVKKNSIINRIKMENWTSSSKIELLVHELHKLRSNNATHKSIIFSQFTTMLQLIEWRLRRAGITTVMLDGSMTPAQRQASIDHFMTRVDVECFLVSLKAGGVALNLTEASRVFIVDPWWNPAAEWQSADRCHRIGQTRPCVITRLCIEDSVESRMVLIQEKKTNMIHSTVNADDKAMESLSPEDMQFLFRGS